MMSYTHVPNRGGQGVKSHLDALGVTAIATAEKILIRNPAPANP